MTSISNLNMKYQLRIRNNAAPSEFALADVNKWSFFEKNDMLQPWYTVLIIQKLAIDSGITDR